MTTRRRHLSPAHRAAISRGLTAYYERQREDIYATAVRSEAARRGWVTRKANEAARSRAAKKGWQTRAARAQEQEERRVARIQRRRAREVERARERFGDFEDYEIEIAVDYVPAGRR